MQTFYLFKSVIVVELIAECEYGFPALAALSGSRAFLSGLKGVVRWETTTAVVSQLVQRPGSSTWNILLVRFVVLHISAFCHFSFEYLSTTTFVLFLIRCFFCAAILVLFFNRFCYSCRFYY